MMESKSARGSETCGYQLTLGTAKRGLLERGTYGPAGEQRVSVRRGSLPEIGAGSTAGRVCGTCRRPERTARAAGGRAGGRAGWRRRGGGWESWSRGGS